MQAILQYLKKQFKDQFDFVNCLPNNAIFGENLGYFVINFKNTEKIYRFTKDFLDGKLFPCESADDDNRAWRKVQFCTLQTVACDTDKGLDFMCREKEKLAGVVTTESRVYRRGGVMKVKSVVRERVEESVAIEAEKSHRIEEEKEEKGRGKRKGREKKVQMEEGNDNEDIKRRNISTAEGGEEVMNRDKKRKKVESGNKKESNSKNEGTNDCNNGCSLPSLPSPLPLFPLDPLDYFDGMIVDDIDTGHPLLPQKGSKKKKNNSNNNTNNDDNDNNKDYGVNSNSNNNNNNNNNNRHSLKEERNKNETKKKKKKEGISKNSDEQCKGNQHENQKQSRFSSSHIFTPQVSAVKNKHITFDSEDESEVRHNLNIKNDSETRGVRERGEDTEKEIKIGGGDKERGTERGTELVMRTVELKTRMKKKREKVTDDNVVEEEQMGVNNDDVILARNGKNVKRRKFTEMDEIPCFKSVKTKRKEWDRGDEEEKGLEKNKKEEGEEKKEGKKNMGGEGMGKRKRKGKGQIGSKEKGMEEGKVEGMGEIQHGSPMPLKKKKNSAALALTSEPAAGAVVIVVGAGAAAVTVQQVDDDKGIIRHTIDQSTQRSPKKKKGQAPINNNNSNNNKKHNDNNNNDSNDTNNNNRYTDNSGNDNNNNNNNNKNNNNNNNCNKMKNTNKKNEETESTTDMVTAENAERKKKQDINVSNMINKDKNLEEEVVNHEDKNKKGKKGSASVLKHLIGTVYKGTLKKFKLIGDDNADSTVSRINWGLDDGAQALGYE